jgi:hypothetical protein
MRTLSVLSVFSLLAVFSSGASAETVTEPSSGVSFEATRTFDGRPYVLVGTGLRKKLGFKVYAMGLYVDESEAKRAFSALATRAGGSDHDKLTGSDHAQSFIIWGQFPKVAVLHLLRNLSAEKIRHTFKESLESQFAAGTMTEDIKKSMDEMLALLDRELKSGQEVLFRTSADGRVEIDINGEKKPGPQNVKLVRALWGVWLGPKTVSKDMRKSLVDRIEVLSR